ncbi:hypothetical protein Tco_1056727 [Tanacetum coccineum]|uniref:Zinc finger, CCHC-type n=1 Tax=Tanacetum coccineum TaxID=301880 RepID=A0ABQ5H3C3_9ASTR
MTTLADKAILSGAHNRPPMLEKDMYDSWKSKPIAAAGAPEVTEGALDMVAAAQNTNNTTIWSILLAEKLTGLNFTNWYRNLRIALRYEKKMKFVEQPIGTAPDPKTDNPDTIDKYYESVNLKQEVSCLMLSSMYPDSQRTLEKYNEFDMMKELKTMFKEQAKQELFETVKAFHACKQEDGQSVSSYLLKMKSYMDTLERLGYAMPKELGVRLILNSLNKDYDQIIQNYNMHSMRKTLAELHEGKIQKDKKKPQGANGKAKGKNKLTYAPKTKIPPPPKRDNPAKDSICHHCKEGLRESKKLKHRALSMYIGNGMRVAVEVIRTRILRRQKLDVEVVKTSHEALQSPRQST